ncbi:MAG: 2-oxoacid:ferredoxin oxidoreductase subunit beta [Planctomycetota bacterium]
MSKDTGLPVLKAKDYASDQTVRWCPGCGDYAILNHVHRVLATVQAQPENTVFVAGIGCSSRFPYYVDTYGLHSIHGRAPGFVTGIKLANPELDVWMVTGDGDGLSIGANHLVHMLRRNVDVNILLFNNRIYGLTKGQYSPTSETGKKTKSTPMGSLDFPLNPAAVALAAEASFVARTADKDRKIGEVLEQAAKHAGSSFVEIYQNCNIFNDGAFDDLTSKDGRDANVLYLEAGKPMTFGKDGRKGVRLVGGQPEVVDLDRDGVAEDDLLFHNPSDRARAALLAQFRRPGYEELPEPFGVLFQAERPTYDGLVEAQVQAAIDQRGPGNLDELLSSGDVYEVE